MKRLFTQLCTVVLAASFATTTLAVETPFATKSGSPAPPALAVEAESTVKVPMLTKTVKTKRFMNRRSFIDGLRQSSSAAPKPVVRKAAAAVPELTGSVTYASSWGEEDKSGLYVIPTVSGAEFEMKIEGLAATSGVEVNGSYYWMSGLDFGFFQFAQGGVYDLATGQSVWSSSLDSFSDMAVDMAFDTSLSWPLVYGLSNSGFTLSYYQFNGSDNSITAFKVADLSQQFQSLAVNAAGTFYAINPDGKLYTLDKNTGAETLVGDTGFKSQYLCGCVFDDNSGKIYRTIVNDLPGITGLIEIDPATAAAQLVIQYPDEESVQGLYVSGEGVAIDPNAVTPPYLNEFDEASSINSFTVVDANADGNTWYWDSSYGTGNGYARILSYTDSKMNDWLISCPILLKGGETYEVSVDAWTKGFPESLEICYGDEPTAAAMTTSVTGVKNLNTTDTEIAPATISGAISPAKTGVYYIGVHGTSPEPGMYLSIDNFAVSAALSGRVPAQVTNLTAVAATGGVKSVTVSFDAPTVNVNGDELDEISSIEVFRNDLSDALKTYSGVTPGASFTFTDAPSASGSYTYTVYAYNSQGRGAVASTEVFCGINRPAAIGLIGIVEDESAPGRVTLSWDAVSKDITGADLAADFVTYNIYGPDDYGYFSELIEAGVTATSYSFVAISGDKQDFVQFAVSPVTESGEGEGRLSAMIPVGKPYGEVRESFPDGAISSGYMWGISSSDYGKWGLFTDETGVPAYDADNGYIGFVGEYIDEWGDLYTAKVDLSGMVNPGFSFQTYSLGAEDTNTVAVKARAVGDEYKTLFEATVCDLVEGGTGWARVAVDLSEFAGKVVQVQITGVVKSYKYILIDDIKLGSQLDNDLNLCDITAPSLVACGSDYDVAVSVANEGTKTAEGWSVEFYVGGEKKETVAGPVLAAGARTQVVLGNSMSALAKEPLTFQAKVVFADDENTANNTSATVTVTPKVSVLPAVTDLSAEESDNAVKLTWTAPDITVIPSEPVTETFEDGEPFAKTFGDWIFYDGDQCALGGFQGIDIPGVEVGVSTGSFFVFNAEGDDFNQYFAAHSGNKYLAALYNYDDSQVDDWAISPELSGDAQTVTFYAKSYSSQYPEKIEVYYSTGSTEPMDFVKVRSATTLAGDWTFFAVDLPEGARRFAIASCAAGGFMLMLDDVTYTPAGDNEGVEIFGYNVYCDGLCITAEPVTETEYTSELSGKHVYVVTTVYNRGESTGSNEVVTGASGLDSLDDTTVTSSVYYDAAGAVSATPFNGFNIRVDTLSDGTTRTSRTIIRK